MRRLRSALDVTSWGLPVRLTLMVGAVLLPWLLVIGIVERQAIEERRDAEVENMRVAAQNAASVVDAFLRDLETTTLSLSLTLARSDAALDQAAVGPTLAAIGREYPEIRSLFVTDAAGRVVASSTGEGIGTDLSARPYLTRLRAGEERVWSGSLAGLQTGEITVAHARSITTAAGTTRGAIVVAFRPERLLGELRLRVAADARVALVDERAQIVYASEPVPPDQVDVRGTVDVDRALAGGEAVVRGEASAASADPRYGAIVPIRRVGWALSLTRPQAAVDAVVVTQAVQSIAATVGVLIVAALFAAALAVSIARPLRQLARWAQEIGRGERPRIAVSGGGPEIRELAATMARMQEAVTRREESLALVTEELRRAVQTRDEFLSVTAHDVRTPLTVLQASADLLVRRLERGDGTDPAAVAQNVERIRSAVRRVQAQIDQLADLSRIRAGLPLEIERRPVDLIALSARVVADIRELAPRHVLRVQRGTVSELIGDWDPSRIERALMNLLTNAVKFSPEGTEVVLSLALEDGDVPIAVVRVLDHGVGIARHDLGRIRRPFARGSNATGVPGSGLGLAIIDQVAAGHGGELRIESTPGKGTTVTLRLPLASALAATAPDQVAR